MKIYTKKGDAGDTSLFGGRRVRKDDLRLESYGGIDELNSYLGMAAAEAAGNALAPAIIGVQNQLFILGSDLATPLDESNVSIPRITEEHIRFLEITIDENEQTLEPIKYFILSGGTRLAALLHVCRTVCRRAERNIVALADAERINPQNLPYINRLSDLLFVLARKANALAGEPDVPWSA